MERSVRHNDPLTDELARLRARVSELEGRAAWYGEARDLTKCESEPLRTVFDNARGAMFVLDGEGHCVDMNPAACALCGYEREEILRRDLSRLFYDDSGGVPAAHFLSSESGLFWPERILQRRDGTVLSVDVTSLPFALKGKDFVLLIIRDVTDRKQSRGSRKRFHDQLERCIEKSAHELQAANRTLKSEVEERKRAQDELKRTKEYLANVIENSVDAIGIVDRQGRFILWNRRAVEIYGYYPEELAGKSSFDLYADLAELDKMLDRLRRDGVVREYEILMKKKDGSIVPMDISISQLKDEHGQTIGSVCVARDLSERKKAEMELKRARDELSRYSKELERQVRDRTREISGILQYTPAVVYHKDVDGNYTLVNARFEELFNVSREAVLGKSDHEVFSQSLADQFRTTDLHVLAEGRPTQVEEHFPHRDGMHTYLSVKFPLYDEHGVATGTCGIATDITELKKAQVQLRRLSGSVMASQEKERAAIARELHDELGQVLTALRMDAVWMMNHLKESDEWASNRAGTMCTMIDKTIDEVRSIALRLRPSVLDDLGLIPALEWYTTDLEKRSGIAIILDHGAFPKVDDLVATAAYRITQEALTNVVRHSSATHAEVSLEGKGEVLTITVTDNGHGFDVRDLAESECVGLAGMHERASLAGGTLDIQSKPGKGTTVRCTLPVYGKPGAGA
ncbi:MAG: PAS domain S-box protein [Syntrophobacteraceae bacterium]